MIDLISRAKAIEVVGAVWSVTGDENVAKVWDQLLNLPSAQPTYSDEEIQKMQDLEQAQIEKAYQLGYDDGKMDAQPERKKGRWIMHIDDLFPAESTMECNQCHEHQPITIDDNFCPNCGADMKGEDYE